jgi:hypothetical protein
MRTFRHGDTLSLRCNFPYDAFFKGITSTDSSIENATLTTTHEPLPARNVETNEYTEFLRSYPVVAENAA